MSGSDVRVPPSIRPTRSPPVPRVAPSMRGKFSYASRLSKSGRPRGTSVHPWMSTSAVCSCSRSASWRDCTSRSHAPSSASSATVTRAGGELTNSPQVSSEPASPSGRPDEVTPNTTSSAPE